MSNVGDFILSSLFSNVVYLSWSIMISHLSPAELPISFIFFWIKSSMSHTIFDSSLVTKPNIETFSNKSECWRSGIVIHDPAISRISDSMLKEDNFSIVCCLRRSNSKDVEDIPIICGYWVRFIDETIFLNNLNESFIKIRISLQMLLFVIFQRMILSDIKSSMLVNSMGSMIGCFM